ncbi:MAG: glycosyltransferase family 2 protein [Polaromonas sp.]|nr:glycosyltransferase family 2 protein [Polaromonas sp.]
MMALAQTTHEVPLVSIVVLNWNGWPMTKDCLKSIEASDYQNYRVLVVDNGSTDDSVANLQAGGGDFELIETGQNLGFTGGCNVGIAKALAQGAEYVVLLNNDARSAPEMLSRMVAAAGKADAAICGARVMDEVGAQILFDGERWPWNIFGLRLPLASSQGESWNDADRVDGSAMLLRKDILERRLLEQGHILAPGFFMYCEETDLCRYGIDKGYRCIVAHDAIAYHGLAKSSGGGGNPRSYYYLTRNRIYLANRWLSLPWKIIFHMYYLPSRLLLQFKRTRAARSAVWQGLKDGYLGVEGMWKRHGG